MLKNIVINEYRFIDVDGRVIYIYGETLLDAIDNYERGLEFDEIYEAKTYR